MVRNAKVSADISQEGKEKLIAICKKYDRSRGYMLDRMIIKFHTEVFGEEKPKEKKTRSNQFKPPIPSAVSQYMLERGVDINQANLEAEKFVDFYGMKGWMVGKNKMKDWKAAVRNWLKGKNNEANKPAINDSGMSSAQQAIAAARQKRDSTQGGSSLGFDGESIHGQVDQEEWSGRVIDMD